MAHSQIQAIQSQLCFRSPHTDSGSWSVESSCRQRSVFTVQLLFFAFCYMDVNLDHVGLPTYYIKTLDQFHLRCLRQLETLPWCTPWTMEYQHMMLDLRLMVDTYEGRKPMANWRRPPGRPRNVWLNEVQNADTRSTTVYAVEI